MQYHRILLKLSGESLQGDRGFGLSTEVLSSYAEQIKRVQSTGVEIGIVIGGGNIFRGLQGAGRGFDRVKGDQMALGLGERRRKGQGADIDTHGAYRRILL